MGHVERRMWPLLVAAGLTLSLLSVGSVWLLGVRIQRTGVYDLAFLPWNLALAWLPLLLAALLYSANRARAPIAPLALLTILWLLFLPNAPYIVTDFVHLGRTRGAPLWFDALLIGSFAANGLLLCYASLFLVQQVISERVGPGAGWTVTLGALALSSVGIYMGRVLRFNSWDVLSRPGDLLHFALVRIADPLGNPQLIGIVAVMTGCLWAGYAAIYAAARVSGLGMGTAQRR